MKQSSKKKRQLLTKVFIYYGCVDCRSLLHPPYIEHLLMMNFCFRGGNRGGGFNKGKSTGFSLGAFLSTLYIWYFSLKERFVQHAYLQKTSIDVWHYGILCMYALPSFLLKGKFIMGTGTVFSVYKYAITNKKYFNKKKIGNVLEYSILCFNITRIRLYLTYFAMFLKQYGN